ncbi:LysR family transcriptional regulator [Paucidesulfovibrio longus]|uniref:LysR family transcriptional regulator n=1 Tax=Paucidesulfovibrio longus TaxID=889 RepID=UPI00138AE505|nr:LysR family transcriptional regulator [Paucidesulfovibrio longus]
MRQLRYFLAVAEELHFSRAAEREHVSQPPLSRQVAALEEELGARLLLRSSRRVALTAEGERVAAMAREIFRAVERGVADVSAMVRGAAGRLRVGFIPMAASTPFPEAVARFRARRPHVELAMVEGDSKSLREKLARRELDAALVRGFGSPEGFRAAAFLREPYVLAVAAGRIKAGDGGVPFESLRDLPLVLYPREGNPGLYDSMAAAFESRGMTMRVAQETASKQAAVGLVAAGLGVALVPAGMRRSARVGVDYLDIADSPLPEVELVVLRRREEMGAVLREFLADMAHMADVAGSASPT